MLVQSENPLIYIFRSHFGDIAAVILETVVFVAIFSCLLANMAVATRMTYSLARDNMLPGSKLLARVSPRTHTPVYAIVLVALIAFGVNLLSEGIAGKVVAIVNVCYYATYALTMAAVLWASSHGRIPDGVPRGFSLGRWLKPAAVGGMLFALVVIANMVVPASGHSALMYFVGAELIGLIWYVTVLRERLRNGTAGPSMDPAAESPQDTIDSVARLSTPDQVESIFDERR
jgi:amino acid transporter